MVLHEEGHLYCIYPIYDLSGVKWGGGYMCNTQLPQGTGRVGRMVHTLHIKYKCSAVDNEETFVRGGSIAGRFHLISAFLFFFGNLLT